MSLVLGIDTSCDETSLAILKDGKDVLSNVISSQIKVHQPHGGVVPELASRSHLEAIPRVAQQALEVAGVTYKDLTGIAVTASPGLIGCLLVGLSFAKTLSYQLKIPMTCVHHLKGHLMSPFIEKKAQFPFLGLVVSGGHTALYYAKSFDDIQCLGQTVDDAAGEAYDKVAKLLGLGYPGGPIIDHLAKQGNAEAYTFTRARVKKGPYYLSYSGLKTAVNLLVKEKMPELHDDPHKLDTFHKDLSASFQKSVVGALINKAEMIMEQHPVKMITVAGGVACNSYLREQIKLLSQKLGIDYSIPSPLLCTDNGAMIAFVGARQLDRGDQAPLDCNAFASKPMW